MVWQRAFAKHEKKSSWPIRTPTPDLLTLQTLYLCGVSYLADPALMPGLIEKTQLPPSRRDLALPVGTGAGRG